MDHSSLVVRRLVEGESLELVILELRVKEEAIFNGNREDVHSLVNPVDRIISAHH